MNFDRRKYQTFLSLYKETQKEFNLFANENILFNDEQAKFLKRLSLWKDYHHKRFELKTMTDNEAAHLVDVMEATAHFAEELTKTTTMATDIVNDEYLFYEAITAMHENHTAEEILQQAPKIKTLCKKHQDTLKEKIAVVNKKKEHLSELKRKAESILNKYSN